jgi:outer membrane protein assembly factor BamB
MLRLGANPPEVLWESKVMRNHMCTSVLIDGHLYGFDEDKAFKCIDLAGNEKWAERGLGKGAVTAAGDRLLVLSGKGELIILRATPEGFTELSRRKVLDGGQCWTDPVLVDGRIYCRSSRGELVCLDHRPEPAGATP